MESSFAVSTSVVTLPETKPASLHLKMDGWNTRFLLGWPIFRCYVGFRECNILVVSFGPDRCFSGSWCLTYLNLESESRVLSVVFLGAVNTQKKRGGNLNANFLRGDLANISLEIEMVKFDRKSNRYRL